MLYGGLFCILSLFEICCASDREVHLKYDDLFKAIAFSEPVAAIQEFFELYGCDPNYIDGNSFSVLALASFQASYETVHYLLQKGAKVNREHQSLSALSAAVENCRLDIVNLLLEYGADTAFVSGRCEIDMRHCTLLHLHCFDSADIQREAKNKGYFQTVTPLERAQLRLFMLSKEKDNDWVCDDKEKEEKNRQIAEYKAIIRVLKKT